MRIIYTLEGIFFVILSYGLLENADIKHHKAAKILKYILFVFSFFIAFRQFTVIDISLENGIITKSSFLFAGDARQYFAWNWSTIFNVLYKYIIPIVCFIFLMVLQEDKASQLEKYQTIVMLEAFILMWVINAVIRYISVYVPAFSLLYMYSHMFMFIMLYTALSKTSVPSGKAMFVSLFRGLVAYILPAFVIGAVCVLFQPSGNNNSSNFFSLFAIVGVIATAFSVWISGLMSTSSKLYTADYENALEKDLANIEYRNAEMDQITARMFEIIKRNVEASSMSVYILTAQNELEVAYSSNNTNVKIPLNNPIFDALLNINKSVVCYSQIEKEHDIAVVQNELEDFFRLTKSDALFILNEGHNIFGIITLGRKASGDHYKDYDYNVFVKLYSYFFVFGYYMRNISNKDVIGVVNREIKMSSQIITSIQENIDHPKTTKVDLGYLMVPAHNIGGEFIDMIRLTDTRHLFIVGDLSGKGIAASMNMVILKSIIRTYLGETHDFKQLVVKLNSFIRDSFIKGTIFSGLFALMDFNTDTMYYINCGVPTLMMYTQVYNNVIEIQGSGHILGFVKDISPYISVKTTKLHTGDIIMACTDGMIQSHSLRGEQYGKERLQQALLDNSTYPAQRMAQFTFDNLLKFMSKEMEDDVSLLVIKYEGLPEPKPDEESEAPVEETAATEATATATEAEVNTAAVEENETATSEPAVNAIEAASEPESEARDSKIADDMPLPDGFEMPDLGDLDAMMKEAGL